MKGYQTYLDRQTPSADLHQRLLALGTAGRSARPSRRPLHWGGLAACCALLAGLAIYTLPRPTTVIENPAHTLTTLEPPAIPTGDPSSDTTGILISSPEDTDPTAFFSMPALNFQDRTSAPEMDYSIALPDGAFTVDLTLSDLQTLFWGAGGKPEEADGDLPWVLFWNGYNVWARATYDGAGDLWMLYIYGEKETDSFTLQLCPGQLPPACTVEPDGDEALCQGVPVTAWYKSYDRDGDGQVEQICVTQFMAGDYGLRFENVSSGTLDDAILFNTLFVRYAISADGGLALYPDDILIETDIPVWREAKFSTLAQAREEAAFAPYLPEQAPGPVTYDEFHGHLSYQEGVENSLFVRWSRGYDDVEISVFLPEGDSPQAQPVDIAVPESYDLRLYPTPWGGSVPEEYLNEFYKPTFRAADMSLAVVEARAGQKDTGSTAYRFNVLLDNGVLIGYDCSGLTSEQVWALVEAVI